MLESNCRVPSVFNNPVVVKSGDEDRREFQKSGLEIIHTFANHSHVPITIVHRSGLKVTLQPNPRLGSTSGLIARTEIRASGESYQSVSKYLSAVGEHASPELLKMRESFQMQLEFSQSRNAGAIILDYPVDLEVLRQHGGTVYYSELDMVVSLESAFTVSEHPYSQAGRDVAFANSLPIPVDGLDFSYAISIVDSTHQIGPRYLNMVGSVYKVTPKVDHTRKDGVYVMSTHEVVGSIKQDGWWVRRFGFENLEATLGLYASSEEAMVHGDAVTAEKMRLAEVEKEIVQLKAERERDLLTQKKEMDVVLHKAEQEKVEAEDRRRKAEEAQRKAEEESERRRLQLRDLMEERSQIRKDGGETLKFLPNLVIGIGAIMLALGKFASS